MSLVGIKNSIGALLKRTKSDDELEHVDHLLNQNQSPYGATDNPDRAQQSANEEAILNAVKSNDYNEEEDEEAKGFFTKFDPRVMSDIIIGLSDGLTVPFALTAGLSSLGSTKIVITGGMAELVSGSISMGLGGYLAAKSELDYYKSEVKKEKLQFFKKPETINQDAAEIMLDLGASESTIASFLKDLDSQPKNLIDFVIRFGKGLEEPAEGREITSALTIGSSYFLGEDCGTNKKFTEGIQMVLIGSVAAGAAWTLVYFIDN
ncbi:hypothetical protein QCA50_017104 [Cerrena zonata]|uniref:Ccc1p n=1 Tax=Cerrena zonata TaxID=2478898 RepID=A0AAW0FR77_9APHY